ncbi:unnamed protein product [Rhizopus microsporus]
MYDDDEEELELLRQYEEENIVGDGRDTYSSEELDSDLEEKILSVTHYDVGVDKKKKKTELQHLNDQHQQRLYRHLMLEVEYYPVNQRVAL